MVEGTVKFFNDMKNFGFIDGDDGKSYFVHSSALAEGTNIREGDRVSFDAAQGDKGPKAENVQKAAEGAEKPAEEKSEEASEEKSEEKTEKSE